MNIAAIFFGIFITSQLYLLPLLSSLFRYARMPIRWCLITTLLLFSPLMMMPAFAIDSWCHYAAATPLLAYAAAAASFCFSFLMSLPAPVPLPARHQVRSSARSRGKERQIFQLLIFLQAFAAFLSLSRITLHIDAAISSLSRFSSSIFIFFIDSFHISLDIFFIFWYFIFSSISLHYGFSFLFDRLIFSHFFFSLHASFHAFSHISAFAFAFIATDISAAIAAITPLRCRHFAAISFITPLRHDAIDFFDTLMFRRYAFISPVLPRRCASCQRHYCHYY